jgi:hypothetical protein
MAVMHLGQGPAPAIPGPPAGVGSFLPAVVWAVVWTAVLLYCAAFLVCGGLLLHRLVRQIVRGRYLDAMLLRLRWRHRRSTGKIRLGSLERWIVWRVLAAGMPDRGRRVVWLPDSVEVLVAPTDLRALGPFAKRIRAGVVERLEALARTRWCRFRGRPVVTLAEDPACLPGRPALRLTFGEATEQAEITADGNGHRRLPAGGSRTRRAYLRPVRPQGAPSYLPSGHRFRIGRLPSCDLVIEQPTLSRHHAAVYQRNGAWYLVDEGSTNGTFVNLAPVAGPVRLADADQISLGTNVSLRFELAPPPSPSTRRSFTPPG